MPNMSKMNKPELYKLCKEQQERIKTLEFNIGCLEEENKDMDKEWECEFNLCKEYSKEVKQLKKQLIEKENKIDEIHSQLVNYRIETLLHTDATTYRKIYKNENEKILKENSDADGVPIGF